LQCENQPILCDAAIGDGPIDAVFKAMERIMDLTAKLDEFDVRSVSEGKDALGEVRVTITIHGRRYQGKGVSTDIIEAAAQAYLKALNKADYDRQNATDSTAGRVTPQP
jgi:2-isopropylmalate synthase